MRARWTCMRPATSRNAPSPGNSRSTRSCPRSRRPRASRPPMPTMHARTGRSNLAWPRRSSRPSLLRPRTTIPNEVASYTIPASGQYQFQCKLTGLDPDAANLTPCLNRYDADTNWIGCVGNPNRMIRRPMRTIPRSVLPLRVSSPSPRRAWPSACSPATRPTRRWAAAWRSGTPRPPTSRPSTARRSRHNGPAAGQRLDAPARRAAARRRRLWAECQRSRGAIPLLHRHRHPRAPDVFQRPAGPGRPRRLVNPHGQLSGDALDIDRNQRQRRTLDQRHAVWSIQRRRLAANLLGVTIAPPALQRFQPTTQPQVDEDGYTLAQGRDRRRAAQPELRHHNRRQGQQPARRLLQ